MVTYKTIVVPTDGSENAKRALEHALAVADRNQAELIVVHVANIVSAISNFDQTPISGGYVSEQIAEDMEETGKEILNDVVKEIPAGVAGTQARDDHASVSEGKDSVGLGAVYSGTASCALFAGRSGCISAVSLEVRERS